MPKCVCLLILLKLERYGIKGDLIMWLKSYLTNRSQKVNKPFLLVKDTFKNTFKKTIKEKYEEKIMVCY
jgi:hypothetical protein